MPGFSERKTLAAGVEVTIEDNKHFNRGSHYSSVTACKYSMAVCENLISNVKYKVEEFTGMEVANITVRVEGVRVND